MSKGMIMVDSFSSGIDEIPARKFCMEAVLRILDRDKRFSVFEATANDRIAKIMDDALKREYIKSIGGEFPWTNVELTDKGRALIDDAKEKSQ